MDATTPVMIIIHAIGYNHFLLITHGLSGLCIFVGLCWLVLRQPIAAIYIFIIAGAAGLLWYFGQTPMAW